MKNLLIALITVVFLAGCTKDETNPRPLESQCLNEHFYYYEGNKLRLDSILRNDYILVGFDSAVIDSEIINFFHSNPEFEDIISTRILHPVNSSFKLVQGKFVKQKSCSQIRDICNALNQSSLIKFANPSYKAGASIGFQDPEKHLCPVLMSLLLG